MAEAATSSRLWVANTTATRFLRRVFSHSRIFAAKAVSPRNSQASSRISSVGRPSKPCSSSRNRADSTGATADGVAIRVSSSKVSNRLVPSAAPSPSNKEPCGPFSVRGSRAAATARSCTRAQNTVRVRCGTGASASATRAAQISSRTRGVGSSPASRTVSASHSEAQARASSRSIPASGWSERPAPGSIARQRPPAARVAARAERPLSKKTTRASGYRNHWRARKASSADFPEPVGPTTIAWPTSPTWSARRNGVDPVVRAVARGGPPRQASSDGPAQTAEIGSRSARLRVDTSGRRISA